MLCDEPLADRFSTQEEHISDKMLFQAADWEPIDSIIQRACWDMARTSKVRRVTLLYANRCTVEAFPQTLYV